MKRKFLSLLSFLLCVWCAFTLQAQSPRFYSASQGLLSTRILRLSFDSEQFLWIATERGLSRFNGLDFSTYTSNRNSAYALHENRLSCILEDVQRQHWVGAMDGLYHFDEAQNRFTYYELSLIRGDRVSVSDIQRIPGDSLHILISSFGRGLYVFDTQQHQLDTLATSRITQLMGRNAHVSRIKFDAQGRLWSITLPGLQVCDPATLQQVPLCGAPATVSRLQSSTVNCLTEDTERQLMYAGSLEGNIYRIDLRTMQVSELPMPQHVLIYSLLLADDHQLLVGTENNGLFSYDLERHTMRQQHYENCPFDLSRCKVHDMAYDHQHNLWLGLYQKGLLVIPSGNPNIHYHSVTVGSPAVNLGCVSCFSEQPDSIVVMGLDGSGLAIYNQAGQALELNKNNSVLETNSVLELAPDGQGGTYVATFSGGIYHLANCRSALEHGTRPRLDTISELSLFKGVRAMTLAFDERSRALYIGTNGAGVYRYHPATKQLSQFDLSAFSRWIISLSIDSQQRLWVGTQNGLGCIDLAHNVVRMIPGSQSLRFYDATECDGRIWFATDESMMYYDEAADHLQPIERPGRQEGEEMTAIVGSGDGMLWMTTTSGLFSYDVKQGRFHSYNCEEVRQVGNYDYASARLWSNGTISFGGDNGIITFDPERMSQPNLGPRPELYFTRLWVNNAQVNYNPDADDNSLDAALSCATHFTMRPGDGAFRLSFSVREYNNPRGMTYEYRLDGHDKGWQKLLGGVKSAYYRELPGGEYTLQVRAYRDEAELASHNYAYRELHITVLKPWYAQWWMKVAYLLLLLAVAWGSWRYLRQRSRDRQVLHQIEEERRVYAEKLRFYTSLTHEFQSPAALLLETVHKLMEQKSDDVTASLYEVLNHNVMRILKLIDPQTDPHKMVQKFSQGIDSSHVKLESQDEKLLQRVLKVIDRNLSDSSFGVEALSHQVGISRVHLNRKLREMLDVSPSALIRNLRLRQATYLLVKNKTSISEVAYQVGFSSPSYFTSTFTQYFGMTPKDFIANYADEPDDERLRRLLHSVEKEAAGRPEELNSDTQGSSSQA